MRFNRDDHVRQPTAPHVRGHRRPVNQSQMMQAIRRKTATAMTFLFNPLQFLVFPFVFLVALPLALCAGFTTILAFLVLFLRLFLVYFDLGLETLRYVLMGNAVHNRYLAAQRIRSHTPSSSASSPPVSSPEASLLRNLRRRRKSSAGSGTMTPVGGLDGLALTPGSGLDRDFEGIGGWRLDSVNVDTDAADDQQWYNLNSRLELPDRRQHVRSYSGPGNCGIGSSTTRSGMLTGAQSPEGLRMTASPNSSRSRTPTSIRQKGFTKLDDDGYFPPYEGKHTKRESV
ncbi:hypothetical protein F5X99DRAFT_397381 [Biscogniauxia marginata]|nr:hypothetical protein F5X99DRAFT_397381 [Biscogniauxia marginata]